ncbi:hypothetical protein ASG59_09595 [Methylobacterium sp. Leaf466]|nr:hypothetical protein ASG59_09595 [Methylobacterium sp. Leaf466]
MRGPGDDARAMTVRGPRAGDRPGARSLAGRFRAAEDGIAAVEFAMFAPILILMIVGCAELSHFANNARKVGFLARAIGEIASHGETLDAAAAAKLFGAAGLILPPFDGTTAKVRLSTIGAPAKDGAVTAKVCSTAATANAAPRAVGEDVTHLFSNEEAGTRFLYVEVEMPYRILFASGILSPDHGSDSLTIRKTLKWPVRKGVRKNSRYPEVVLPIGGACTA